MTEVTGNTRRVTYNTTEDFTKKAPELWLDVFLVGPPQDTAGFATQLMKTRCRKADNIRTADFVIFTGGADVNPALYGEPAHPRTGYNDLRDKSDIGFFNYCVLNGIPMAGVCRGAQFIHVMQGGKLFQHVDGHGRAHTMYDPVTNKVLSTVSSVHHQSVIPNKEMLVCGVSTGISTSRWRNPTVCDTGSHGDIEAFYYRDIAAFCVQGHPEYSGYQEYTQWWFEGLNKYINENPDLEVREVAPESKLKALRMKPGLLEKRLKARKWVVDPFQKEEGTA